MSREGNKYLPRLPSSWERDQVHFGWYAVLPYCIPLVELCIFLRDLQPLGYKVNNILDMCNEAALGGVPKSLPRG